MQQSSLMQIYEDAVKRRIKLNPKERFNYYLKTQQYDKLSKDEIIEFLNTESSLFTTERLFKELGKSNKRYEFIENIILSKFKDAVLSRTSRIKHQKGDKWVAWIAGDYAKYIIKDRWPEAEDIIKTNEDAFRTYQWFLERNKK